MKPKHKKILMILGAAIGGYVIYTKVIKKPAPAAMPAAAARAAMLVNKAALLQAATRTA